MSIFKKIMITILILMVIVIIGIGVYYYQNKKIEMSKINYQLEKVEDYNYFILKSNEKCGVIDNQGNIIINTEYESIKIPNPSKDLFICYNSGKSKILNSNNEEILQQYNNIEPIKLDNIATDLVYEKSVLTYKENNKIGLIDFQGNILVDPIYDNIEGLTYKEGELLIKRDNKVGLININGYKIIDTIYDNINVENISIGENKKLGYIVENRTEDGIRYGYIDNEGKLKIDVQYNEIIKLENYKENYIIASKNGQYGFLKNYENVIDFVYQNIEYDSENEVLILQKGSKYGLSNLNGNILIPVENTELNINGLYVYAKKDDNQIVYDINGKIKDIDFNTIITKTENKNYNIKIQNNKNRNIYGIIDNEDKEVIPNKYLYLEYAYGDYFIACGENGKLGVIDINNNIIVNLEYDLVQKINDKEIIQTLNTNTKTTEIYSSDMKKTLEIKDASIEKEKDYIKIYSKDELKYVDNKGNIIENKDIINNELFAYKEVDKWGFVNKDGSIKIKAEYERVTEFNKYGFAAIRKNGKWGSIDKSGNIIVEPIYELEYIEPNFISKYYKNQYGFGEIYYTDFTK